MLPKLLQASFCQTGLLLRLGSASNLFLQNSSNCRDLDHAAAFRTAMLTFLSFWVLKAVAKKKGILGENIRNWSTARMGIIHNSSHFRCSISSTEIAGYPQPFQSILSTALLFAS